MKKLFAQIVRLLLFTPATVHLSLSNLLRRSTIAKPGTGAPAISLTSHGARVRSVFLSIESVGRGSVLPSEVHLFLDSHLRTQPLPRSLKRLAKRGLTIHYVGGEYGPHTKYYPYANMKVNHTINMATIDDDIVYPRTWLAQLFEASANYPEEIVGYRCKRILLLSGQQEGLAHYRDWTPVTNSSASFAHFATGVSGVLYPPSFLNHLREVGDGFRETCPRADDVWLHAQALRSFTRVRQVGSRSRHFAVVPFTQKIALWRSNDVGRANDWQIQMTYDCDLISLILDDLNGI